MSDRPTKFGAEDLRQLAWRNSYLQSKDEQEIRSSHPIPRVTKFGIKRDSCASNKTTLPPLVEDCIPSVARHGIFNNEPMPLKNPWYKRRTSLPSNITCKHQHQRNSIEFNYPSTGHFNPQVTTGGGKNKAVPILPIASNMMSGSLPQPSSQRRRSSLPVMLGIRNSEQTDSVTSTSTKTGEHTHIDLQNDSALLNKRKRK